MLTKEKNNLDAKYVKKKGRSDKEKLEILREQHAQAQLAQEKLALQQHDQIANLRHVKDNQIERQNCEIIQLKKYIKSL